jgi:hypothetical protein
MTPLRVGDWCVNPASGEISRNGEIVRINRGASRKLAVPSMIAMRVTLAGLVISATALTGCTSPTAPDPPVHYLTIIGASSCLAFFQMPRVFGLSTASYEGDAQVFHLVDTDQWVSARPISSGTDITLSLTITPTEVRGTMQGEARWPNDPGIFSLSGTIDSDRSSRTGGIWTGSMGIRTFGLSSSVGCSAADHQWSFR